MESSIPVSPALTYWRENREEMRTHYVSQRTHSIAKAVFSGIFVAAAIAAVVLAAMGIIPMPSLAVGIIVLVALPVAAIVTIIVALNILNKDWNKYHEESSMKELCERMANASLEQMCALRSALGTFGSGKKGEVAYLRIEPNEIRDGVLKLCDEYMAAKDGSTKDRLDKQWKQDVRADLVGELPFKVASERPVDGRDSDDEEGAELQRRSPSSRLSDGKKEALTSPTADPAPHAGTGASKSASPAAPRPRVEAPSTPAALPAPSGAPADPATPAPTGVRTSPAPAPASPQAAPAATAEEVLDGGQAPSGTPGLVSGPPGNARISDSGSDSDSDDAS